MSWLPNILTDTELRSKLIQWRKMDDKLGEAFPRLHRAGASRHKQPNLKWKKAQDVR